MAKIPIYIVGINPRSGTNYLFNLLLLHPDCVSSKHFGEDFILFNADKYFEFINGVTSKWIIDWYNNPEVFKKSLEHGILHYLEPEDTEGTYMVTKTPDPQHADLFLKMFSSGYMIIITRKGQDLTESFIRTFKNRFDDAVRGWVIGAKWISKVINNPELMNSERVIIIKYEELFKENEKVMSRILDFLKLDKSVYDFNRSANFDVIGSSSFKSNEGHVTWDPIKKDKSFNPLNRFSDWNRFRHYRFNWLAGKYMKLLGYELYFDSKNPIYYCYNLIMMTYDFTYRVVRAITKKVNSKFK